MPSGIGSRTAIAAALLFLLIVIKNAWACDDAYIVFRSLEQLFAGNGPVWNPHERVQAFTSPLWFWLLSVPRLVSQDVYINAIVVSIGLAAITILLVRRALRDDAKFIVAVLLFVCCNGFLDFTTSGLENPLAFALIAFYLLHYVRLFDHPDADAAGSRSRLALAFGLVVVTRHDLALLLLPSFIHAVVSSRKGIDRRGWMRLAALAGGPLAAWSLFALVYYGSIFPNPALAKLNTDIPAADLMRQGGRYLLASLRYDTISVIVLAAGLVAAFTTRMRWMRALALGVLANVAYVVTVGGDFMIGRFLSCAYLVSVVMLLVCIDFRGIARTATVAAALIVYALLYPHTPVNSGRGYSNLKHYSGIADERGVFFNDTSLYKYVAHVSAPPGSRLPYFPDQASAKRGYEIGRGPHKLSDTAMIGFFGYWSGTRLIIADRLGLADPFLARLPAADGKSWRIGHFQRPPVPGYYESIVYGEARIKDPALNELYRKVRLVTQGPLFSSERWKAISTLSRGM